MGDEDEVGVRRQRLEAERSQLPCEPLALLDDSKDVWRPLQSGDRERGGERRDGRRGLAAAELGREVAAGERIAGAGSRQAERLLEKVRMTTTSSLEISPAAVSPAYS